MQFRSRLILGLVILSCALAAPLSAQDQMPYAAAASSKFMSLPMLPACMTFVSAAWRPDEKTCRPAVEVQERLRRALALAHGG